MRWRGALATIGLFALCAVSGCARCGSQKAPAATTPPAEPAMLDGRPVRLDANGKILAWSSGASPYAEVATLAWNAIKRVPNQPNGLPTYFTYSRFMPVSFAGVDWPHNPAGLNAMMIDSALLYYAFSGDAEVVAIARRLADYQIAHGTSPGGYAWGRVPFASAPPGATEFRGMDDAWCDHCGRGDGALFLEPDKVGELGMEYLRLFESTGDERYRRAAVDCADALAARVRRGDMTHSPWPFRVHAQSGVAREEYTADVLPAIMLFDELARTGLAEAAKRSGYDAARRVAWEWLMAYPMKNDLWTAYFEDIPISDDPADNPNQYVPVQTAQYLLAHPELDPDWRAHVAHILDWVLATFGQDANEERGFQYGAHVISEQRADMAKMGSHTARYAALHALWFERTGAQASREEAFRSFNWATYMCDPSGTVVVGEDRNEGWWFSDGYGDYIRHFLIGMAAVPDWAPAGENHLLRTSSVPKSVAYEPAAVRYDTFDAEALDVLRLTAAPSAITAGGEPLERVADRARDGFTVTPLSGGGVLVTVKRSRTPVAISLSR